MDRYAVVGHPLGHTKSPLIHGMFARATGQALAYTALESPLSGFAATLAAFRASGGRGINVTAPFKLEAFALATDLMERARLAGAVNAIKFEDGRIIADNFDGMGLVTDIECNLATPLAGGRVLLLGAGGAARGALLPILQRQPEQLVIANRTVAKAEALAERFSARGRVVAAGYPALAGRDFDIVINATSASLHGELPPVPKGVFGDGCLAYELVYGKGMTPFLRLAREAYARSLADGVGMLVEQAAEAFLWWRGVRPETREVIAAIAVALHD